MKKTVNKTKKVVKPDFVMNLITPRTANDLYVEFIEAKVRAGKPITIDELDYAKDVYADEVIDEAIYELKTICNSIPYTEYEVKNGAKLVFDEHGNAKVVKPNIFKRFWNWITRK